MKQCYFFSTPGRAELSGNQVDHQHGCVLAGSVNLQTVAEVSLNDLGVIRVDSEGFPKVEVALNDLSFRESEKNTTAALVRGVAAAFRQRGCVLRGFDAQVRSDVLPGSGLSSSAAFEVLMATICNELFFDKRLSPVELARIGQWAENVYFGKPCGLLDQMACAVGGMVFMDFADPENPVVERLDFDFSRSGYALCIIDAGASHAGMTDAYAAVPGEMKAVSALFGKSVLREVSEEEFYAKLPQIRGQVPDRAIMRAMHFYQENRRVRQQVAALRRNDFESFLRLVRESGYSSWMYVQNVIPAGAVEHQEMAVALGLCDILLQGRGAYRVHGGGFAGTAEAFVPMEMLDGFKRGIEAVLGAGSCHVLSIRREGSVGLQ